MKNLAVMNRSAVFKERAESLLKKMCQRQPHIMGVALLSSDGLTLAHSLRESVNPARFGALSATLLGLGESFIKELAKGKLEQVSLHGSDSTLFFIKVGKHHVLGVEADAEIKLGMLLYEAKRTAGAIHTVIQVSKSPDTR